MLDSYSGQWNDLLIKFSVNETIALSVYQKIKAAYEESGRYYHTLAHIEQVLQTAAELKDLVHDYAALQLAIWFHDIIYNPRADDNEIQSAVYAQSLLAEISIPDDTIQKVGQLIMATASHTNPGEDPDTFILLDADLAVLGSDEKTFGAYCQAIRQEYEWVPEAVYRPARINILTQFLKRPSIYHTPLLKERIERNARENIKREIGRLS